MKRMSFAVAAGALAVAAAITISPARAQGTMSGMSMAPTSPADTQYLTQDAQGSVSDHTTAELGLEMATSEAVHSLAMTIVKDHDKENIELLEFAHNRMLALPVTMSSDDQTRLETLAATPRGDAFDKAFLQESVQTNGQDVSDAQKEIAATTDPQVKKLVQGFLAVEQKHLKLSQQLLTQMGS